MKIFLPFHIAKLVKSLPFYIPEAWKRHPFRADTPRIGHCREYPPPRGFHRLNKYFEISRNWRNTNAIFCISFNSDLEKELKSRKLTWLCLMLQYRLLKILKTLCHLPWCIASKKINCGPRNRHFYAKLWLQRKSVSIVLYIVGIRSCLSVFQFYSFTSSAFAIL